MTRAVAAVPGVLDEQVNLRRDELTVKYNPHRTSSQAIALQSAAPVIILTGKGV